MPGYSTDKGFTGSAGGLGAGKKKDDKGGLGAMGYKGGTSLKNAPISDLSEESKKSLTQGGTGAGGTKKSKLPPGLNPAKYQENTTPSYEATLSNIGTLVGQAVAGLALPGAGIGLGPLAGEITGVGPSFENPTGPQVKGDYDSAAQENQAAQGNVASQMGGDASLAKVSAIQAKKKKVEEKPGFTLLKGAGGTLLGN